MHSVRSAAHARHTHPLLFPITFSPAAIGLNASVTGVIVPHRNPCTVLRHQLAVLLGGEPPEGARQTRNQHVVHGEALRLQLLHVLHGGVHRAEHDVARRRRVEGGRAHERVALVVWREDGLEGPLDAAPREHERIHAEGLGRPRTNVAAVVVRGLEEDAHDVDAVQQRVVVAQEQCGLAVFRTDDVREQKDLPHRVMDVQLHLVVILTLLSRH